MVVECLTAKVVGVSVRVSGCSGRVSDCRCGGGVSASVWL